jgi:hypothetical protein
MRKTFCQPLNLSRTGNALRSRCILFLCLFLVLSVSQSIAANRFAVVSGNWHATGPTIWSATVGGAAGASVPVAGDVVTINAGVVVDVTTAIALATTVTVNGTLNISSTFDLQFPTTGTGGTLTVANGGTLTLSSGGQVLGGGNTGAGIAVTISSGATLKTANTLGFTTGTGNTTLTGSIAVRPGSKTISYNANVDYTFNGSAAQVTGNAVTATSDLIISNTAGVTPSASIIASGVVTISGGATLSLAATTLTLSGAGTPLVITGTLTPNTSTITYSGGSAQNITEATYNNLSFSGAGAKTVQTGDNIVINGNWVTGTAAISLAGTSSVTVGANVSGSGAITMASGTLTLNGSAANAFANTGTFTRGSGTVVYSRAGAQTVRQTTYNNLTLGGTGSPNVKTTTTVTVAGVLSMEGTATVSALPTYQGTTTLQYNTNTARSSGVEWPASFAGSGGIIIDNVGAITMATANKALTAGPLNIKTGATLTTGNFDLSLTDDLINSGNWTNSTNDVTVTGTATQSIGTFSTTGAFISTKSGGTATVTDDLFVGAITMSTAGGTVNLGTGHTHTVTGTVTLNNGTLNGGSSTLIVSVGWAGTTATVFVPGSGTVNFRAGNQTLNATGTKTFNNLTLSGSGTKTISGTTATINGILSIEGAAVPSVAVNYGADATLQYNTTGNRNTGVEWPATFSGSGGVIIDNVGIITLIANKVLNTDAPFNIKSGATFNAAAFDMTFNNDFIRVGNWTSNSGDVTVTGTNTQAIAGFTTSGLFLVTKSGGTATLSSNVNAATFTLNASGGTLSLGAGLTHTFSGTFTFQAGSIIANNSTLNLDGAIVPSGGAMDAGSGAVNFRGNVPQTVPAINYWDLSFSGTGAKTFAGNANAFNTVTVNSGASVDFGSITFQIAGSGTPFVNNGSITIGTSTIGYVGTGLTTIIPLNYYNLTTTGGDRILSTAANIGISNVFTPAGGVTYTVTGSTVDFNGNTTQNIPAFNFDKLIVSNGSIKKILATVIVGCQSIDINDTASVEINADGLGRLNISGP